MQVQFGTGLGLTVAEVVGKLDLLRREDVLCATGFVQRFHEGQHFGARLAEQRHGHSGFSGALLEATEGHRYGLHLGGRVERLERLDVQAKGAQRSAGSL